MQLERLFTDAGDLEVEEITKDRRQRDRRQISEIPKRNVYGEKFWENAPTVIKQKHSQLKQVENSEQLYTKKI